MVKTAAAKRFSVARAAIYQWLNAPDPLACGKPGPREPRLLDPVALAEHVKAHPDQTLKERARHFGVSRSCIAYGLRTYKLTSPDVLGTASDFCGLPNRLPNCRQQNVNIP